MWVNPKTLRENSDEDICLYHLRIDERMPMYQSFWAMYSWHSNKEMCMWTNNNGFLDEPKDGNICKYCGREILIVNKEIHR